MYWESMSPSHLGLTRGPDFGSTRWPSGAKELTCVRDWMVFIHPAVDGVCGVVSAKRYTIETTERVLTGAAT